MKNSFQCRKPFSKRQELSANLPPLVTERLVLIAKGKNPMIIFNFTRFFKLKGITRPFTYLTRNGYSAGYATKLSNDRVYEINLVRLEKFCRDFNCTPNDILDFKPHSDDNMPKDHALHSLTKKELNNELVNKINNLPADKIQQIHDIIKNME